MARQILFDELHVTVYMPKALGDRELSRIRRVLAKDSLRTCLRLAVRAFVLRHPELKPIRIAIAR